MEKRKEVFPFVLLSLTLSFSHLRTLKRPQGRFRVLAVRRAAASRAAATARRAAVRRAAAPARRALAALRAAIRRASAGRRRAPTPCSRSPARRP
ncbi:hypothetical protein R1flu_011224 [Riccia fluitans]|uniref:Uncharacterized protein n=1 Tax=Riccia fluitans TaxID=41844 RepID=A0ABD1ZBE1_9MARC